MRRVRDIPAGLIALRISVAESFGADRFEILKEASISPDIFKNPKARASVEQAMGVWREIVRQTGSHDIGLECGLKARFQTMGILGYVMMNSPNIIQAWNKLYDYQELVLSILLQKVNIEKDLVRIEGTMQEEWQDEFRYTIDFIYTASLTLIKNCTSQNIHPLEVGFNFPEPSNVKRYHEIYDPAVIKFSCDNPYIVYKKSDLENQITAFDPNIFEHFEVLLKEIANEHDRVNANTRAVKQCILKRLKAEIPKADDVARELAMSVRTLQKNLKNEGSSFRKILNTVRKEVAIKHLSLSHNNVTDVAFLTGFSDISVFSRNFKKWTGITPTEFQNQQ
jgi:AraC-like DNA-binding protein